MKNRKTIAVITMRPDGIYQKRIMEGLQFQCGQYGYNLAVFTPLVDITHYHKEYLHSEMNIFNLPDFSRFDAVIIMAISLTLNNDETFLKDVIRKIKDESDIPIIALDGEQEGCYSAFTDDMTAFYRITNHVIEEHGCKKIYMLTGFENNGISQKRLDGFEKSMNEHGISFSEKDIFYGDFWYTSGEKLAESILSGEVPMPDAVVCACDYCAAGLVNSLAAKGIKIPQQLIVTGYDAATEIMMNNISITSYVPDVSFMAAQAVDKIKEIIEPERPICAEKGDFNSGIIIGESCGCKVDFRVHRKHIREIAYTSNRNYGDEQISNVSSLSTHIENYMLESLTPAETPVECLKLIYSFAYLIEPYDNFYLCLKPDWLDTEVVLTEGYPDTMRCVIHAIPAKMVNNPGAILHCRNKERDNFSTKLMLPEMWEYTETPEVFYFVPCHFTKNTLGYAVYNCRMERKSQITVSFLLWLRNVNTALEMVRTRNKLIGSSLIDSMTKLYNRRGMTMRINDLLRVSESGDMLLSIVIDMDGLKYINDTYGHNEGDDAIITVASVVRCITGAGESSCRAGGDEFYILGIGKFTEEYISDKIKRFYSMLDEQNKQRIKPYAVTASVGYNLIPVSDKINISEAIAAADKKMYISKSKRKKEFAE